MPCRTNPRSFQHEKEMGSVTVNVTQLTSVHEMTNQTFTLIFVNACTGRLALMDFIIEKDFHNGMNFNVKGVLFTTQKG